jgi:hypothetical protein
MSLRTTEQRTYTDKTHPKLAQSWNLVAFQDCAPKQLLRYHPFNNANFVSYKLCRRGSLGYT